MADEMLNWLKEHIKNTPYDELKKEWDVIESMDLEGPNALEYAKGMNSVYQEAFFYPPPTNNIKTDDKIASNFGAICFLITIAK
jgi:hypothetical protein